jgi:hypothetical protein
LRLVDRTELLVDEHPYVPHDWRHGRCELVADVAVELRAQPLDLAQPLVCGAKLSHFLFEMSYDSVTLEAQPLTGGVRARCVGFAVTGEKASDERREAPRINRLLDESVAPDGETRVPIPLRGDRDDGNSTERRLAAQAQCHLVTVEAGYVEVDKDQIRANCEGAPNPLQAVGRIDDLVSFGGQELAHEKTISLVILDV